MNILNSEKYNKKKKLILIISFFLLNYTNTLACEIDPVKSLNGEISCKSNNDKMPLTYSNFDLKKIPINKGLVYDKIINNQLIMSNPINQNKKTKKIYTKPLIDSNNKLISLINTTLADPIYTTSDDGAVTSYAQSTSWSTVYGYSSGNYYSDSQTLLFDGATMHPGFIKHPDSKYSISRGYLPFDTTDAIPAGATNITASIYIKAYPNTRPSNKYFVLVDASNVDNTGLGLSSFGSFSTTEVSEQVNTNSMSDDTYVEFPLNATGLTMINENYSEFGLRISEDLTSSAPADGTGTYNVAFYASEQSGLTSDPYLEITYDEATEATSTPTDFNTEFYVGLFKIFTAISGIMILLKATNYFFI